MPTVRTSDLIDSAEVADILGLSHRNSVTTYSRRYPDFPRPTVVIGRMKLWLRSEIQGWSPQGRLRGPAESNNEPARAELIAAAAQLMSERPISDISIREIAAAAGVAHALIYRYFGSKAELQRAVVEQALAEMVAVARAQPGASKESMERLITELRGRSSSLRVLLQALGTPQGAQEFGSSAPVMSALMAGLRAEADQGGTTAPPRLMELRPEVAVGAVGALIVGWIAFEPKIDAATGLSGIPTKELAALCAEILARGAQPSRTEP